MSHDTHASHDTHDASHAHGGLHVHVMPMSVLIGVFALLMVLTLATVAATWVDFGSSINLWIALLIAFVKAAFVCLYFMHLRYDNPFNGLVVCASLLFVVLFIGFALMDSGQYMPNIRAGAERAAANSGK